MRTNLEAAEQPVVFDTSAFCDMARVWNSKNSLLASILSESRISTIRRAAGCVNHEETNLGADWNWWLLNMTVELCHAVTSYPDLSPDFCVIASISVLYASKINKKLNKFHICVTYSNGIPVFVFSRLVRCVLKLRLQTVLYWWASNRETLWTEGSRPIVLVLGVAKSSALAHRRCRPIAIAVTGVSSDVRYTGKT